MKRYDFDNLGCRSCGTKRHKEKRNGYCSRCLYKVRKVARLQRELASLPMTSASAHIRGLESCLYHTESDLRTLRSLEEPFVRKQFCPQDIEGLLFALANVTRARPDEGWYNNLSGYLFCSIPPDANQEIYKIFYILLLNLVETLPSHGYRRPFWTLWTWVSHRTSRDTSEEFELWRARRESVRP